ncbi:MAG: hypothetical protein AUJ48_01280 [Deltaproteobacteria bacterium CG1_02_45_11]|nr:MAG: hypothetical protein AUJ48_01280 [Deltaproteobacteria bacterium CG1_02_45_11]
MGNYQLGFKCKIDELIHALANHCGIEGPVILSNKDAEGAIMTLLNLVGSGHLYGGGGDTGAPSEHMCNKYIKSVECIFEGNDRVVIVRLTVDEDNIKELAPCAKKLQNIISA